MGIFFKARRSCYCAFCKSPRQIYIKKRVSIVNLLASSLVSFVFIIAFFGEWDPRFFIVFVAALAVGEIFVQLRWRMSIVCNHCGFDPILYLKDIDAAVLKVQTRLDERKNDPNMLLVQPLNLPKVRKANIEKIVAKDVNKGRILSKQV